MDTNESQSDIKAEKLSIDRFEDNDLAVLISENKKSYTVPRQWLPERCKEGDILLTLQSENNVSFVVDVEATAAKQEELSELRASIPQALDGDIDL